MSGVVWVSAHPRIKYGAGSERVEGHEGNGTALPLTWFDKLTMSGATNHHHSCVWAMRCRGGSRTAPTHMVRPAHHEREEVGMSVKGGRSMHAREGRAHAGFVHACYNNCIPRIPECGGPHCQSCYRNLYATSVTTRVCNSRPPQTCRHCKP